jgi:hypothetical protein
MHNTYFISRGELQLSNLSRIPKVQSYKVTILPHKSTDNFFFKTKPRYKSTKICRIELRFQIWIGTPKQVIWIVYATRFAPFAESRCSQHKQNFFSAPPLPRGNSRHNWTGKKFYASHGPLSAKMCQEPHLALATGALSCHAVTPRAICLYMTERLLCGVKRASSNALTSSPLMTS